LDEYRFPGFRPKAHIQGMFGDPKARVIRLERTQKKRYVDCVAWHIGVITTREFAMYGTCLAGMPAFIWKWKSDGYGAGSAKK